MSMFLKYVKADIKHFLLIQKRKINNRRYLGALTNSSIQTVILLRLINSCYDSNIFLRIAGKIISWLTERFYSTRSFTSAIGSGLYIPHPLCIIINAESIGENVTILQGVTIGISNENTGERPVIGNNVYIGAGAKVLGGIIIGDNAVIGANAVVIRDVPRNYLAIGVPAKLKKQNVQEVSG